MRRKCNDTFFKTLNEESAYVLGMISSDGWISNNQVNLMLHERDESIVRQIRNLLGIDIKYPLVRRTMRTSPMVGFSITSEQMVEDLNSYGIVPAKSKILQYPRNISDNLFFHYLRGLIDGDGTIGDTPTPYLQLLGTKSLLTGIETTCSRLIGATANVRKRKDADIWIVKWYAGSLDIIDAIYKNANIYMERKYNKYKNISNDQESSGRHAGRLIRKSLDKKDIIQKYKKKIDSFIESNKRTPTAREFLYMGSYATVYKYFGSFNRMIENFGHESRPAIKVKI